MTLPPCVKFGLGVAASLLVLSGPGCRGVGVPQTPPPAPDAGSEEKGSVPETGGGGSTTKNWVPITVIATNDIHGGVEASPHAASQSLIGGMDLFAGIVSSIRRSVEARGGGVVVVDAGDQFQGTLVSNFNEGQLVFRLLDEIGYDAVVPGNHDYDFGPKGWLKDRTSAPDENPREVIEGLAASAQFPLISANTYFKKSLKDRVSGQPVSVASHSCMAASGTQIDWSRAERPRFLKPFTIKTIRGVRVAMIGLDNPSTGTMTTVSNVSDLCFRDPVETYTEIASALKNQADIFLLVVHGADSPGHAELSGWVRELVKQKKVRLDAVVAGHTHMIQKLSVEGVPVIQSGSGGERFGRIDFVFDRSKGKIIADQTQVVGGAAILHGQCDTPRVSFCEAKQGGPGYQGLKYDQIPVTLNARATQMIQAARQDVSSLADRKLFVAKSSLKRNRTSESAVANLLTDMLRRSSAAEVAFLNTGGIRDEIQAGDVTYEQLFKVLPFGNLAVVAEPMSAERLLKLLQRSIETCGEYGALMQSGLRVQFTRDCVKNNRSTDPQARLVRVETLSGEVILDEERGIYDSTRQFKVATLDFLLDGGSGYSDFKGVPKTGELGLIRERLADEFSAMSPLLEVSGALDGRWQELPAK